MAVGGYPKSMVYPKFMAKSVYQLKSVARHCVYVAALRRGDYITGEFKRDLQFKYFGIS